MSSSPVTSYDFDGAVINILQRFGENPRVLGSVPDGSPSRQSGDTQINGQSVGSRFSK